MGTATMTGSREKRRNIEGARTRKLAEAHVLAGRIWEHYQAAARHPAPCAADKAVFMRALILQTAAELGFPAASRSELRPAERGRVCTALRARMQELGIEEPEHRRDARAAETGEATTAQWNQITLLVDRVRTDPAGPQWSAPHLRNWLKSRLRIRSLHRRLTQAQARAVIFGLEGVLRHGHKSTKTQRGTDAGTS